MTTNTERNIESTNTGTNAKASQPVAKLRIGLLSGSIWQRVSQEGTFHAVSFERRYRDKEGNWHTSHSFDTEDLLALSKLADQAHSRILELRGNQTD
jgi:hypothetical protein